jgi:hypothetical protein
MATYTGTTQAKRGFGAMIWVAVVAFVVAAALTIALLAMQGGSPATGSSGNGQTQTQTNGTGGGSGEVQTIPRGNGICARCAP